MTHKKRPYEERLKARLLKYNPWFRDRVSLIRSALGIPIDGFKKEQALQYAIEEWGERARCASIFRSHLKTMGKEDAEDALEQLIVESKSGPIKIGKLEIDLAALDREQPELWNEELFAYYEVEGIKGRMANYMQYQRKPRLYDHVIDLIEGFDLPQRIFGSIVWHILTGEEPEEPETDIHLETFLDFWNCTDSRTHFPHKLIPSAHSYFALRVDQYLTRQEFYSMWPQVKELRDKVCKSTGIRPPRGKRVLEMPEAQFQEWIDIWKIYLEQNKKKSYEKIADIYCKRYDSQLVSETIRHAIREIERLMKPK